MTGGPPPGPPAITAPSWPSVAPPQVLGGRTRSARETAVAGPATEELAAARQWTASGPARRRSSPGQQDCSELADLCSVLISRSGTDRRADSAFCSPAYVSCHGSGRFQEWRHVGLSELGAARLERDHESLVFPSFSVSRLSTGRDATGVTDRGRNGCPGLICRLRADGAEVVRSKAGDLPGVRRDGKPPSTPPSGHHIRRVLVGRTRAGLFQYPVTPMT